MAEERSVVVIYFSGHGFQLEDDLEIKDPKNDVLHFDQGILPADLTKETVSTHLLNKVKF